ncbi:MAG: hypothetical protein NUV81_02840 [bacterium]|nr:hypothetical protein [bacterium]
MEPRDIDRSFNAYDPKPIDTIIDDNDVLPERITICLIVIRINVTGDTATLALSFERDGNERDRYEFDDCLNITELPIWNVSTHIVFEIFRAENMNRFKSALIEHILAKDSVLEINVDGEYIEFSLEIGSQTLMVRVPAEEFTNAMTATSKIPEKRESARFIYRE